MKAFALSVALATLMFMAPAALAQQDASQPTVVPPASEPGTATQAAEAKKQAAEAKKKAKQEQAYRDAHDPNKVICKTTEGDESRMGGSRLGGARTCMTRAQWDQAAQQEGQDLNSMLRQPLVTH